MIIARYLVTIGLCRLPLRRHAEVCRQMFTMRTPTPCVLYTIEGPSVLSKIRPPEAELRCCLGTPDQRAGNRQVSLWGKALNQETWYNNRNRALSAEKDEDLPRLHLGGIAGLGRNESLFHLC